MKRRGTFLWILAALAALWAAGGRHEALRAARHSQWPGTDSGRIEDLPPLVAFTTVALGGFQGLIADLLWLRVARLQEQGHYFEIVQLADWITKLEPRFSDVWAYHAWNMAYNISVMFPDPEDRWRWVRHGIQLLRDEGLRYNPSDPQLYRELGWIYQHKIGRHWDDAHMKYKWELALEMDVFLENGYIDIERFSNDPDLRRRLRGDHGLDPDMMLKFQETYGPLDWRAADTHAVYWAWLGLQRAPPEGAMGNKRMIFQGLAHSFSQGRIIINRERRILLTSPNLDIYDTVRKAFIDALEQYDRSETILIAYRNFLTDAMMLFFVYGHGVSAQSAYDELREIFPEDLKGDMQSAVIHVFLEDMQEVSLRHATAVIEGFYLKSVVYQAMGQTEQANAMNQIARFLWQRAEDRFGGREATAMPPIEEVRQMAVERARLIYGPLF